MIIGSRNLINYIEMALLCEPTIRLDWFGYQPKFWPNLPFQFSYQFDGICKLINQTKPILNVEKSKQTTTLNVAKMIVQSKVN